MTISREAQSIIDYVESTGLPYRVTDVSGPGHAEGSYHYAKGTDGDGLAVDFGGSIPGVTPSTAKEMGNIWRAFMFVAPQLAELIHNNPAEGITKAIKNGRMVDGASFYGPVVWPDHRDHVHVAVPRGVFLTPLSQPLGTLIGDDMAVEIVGFQATPSGRGYWILTSNGGLYAFGDAEYLGGLRIDGDTVEAVAPEPER